MSEDNQNTATMSNGDGLEGLKPKWGWLVALGIAFIVLGVIGLGMTTSLTLVGIVFFAWLLIIGGVLQIVQTFQVSGWKSVLWHVVLAILYILAGAIVLYNPVQGAVTLTLFLGIVFVVTGIARSIMSFQLRPEPVWGWVLFSGIVSIILGLMILAQCPVSSLWLIVLMISVELIANGWSYLIIGLAAKSVRDKVAYARANQPG